MADKIRNSTPYVICTGLFCLLLLVVLRFDAVFYRTPAGENTAFPGIYSATQLEQDLVMEKTTTLRSVDIRFATYARENQGEITVSFAINQRVIKEETFEASTLEDNTYRAIGGLNIPVQNGDLLTVSVSSTAADSGNAITVWYSDRKSSGSQLRKVTDQGAEILSGEANIRLHCKDTLGYYLTSRYWNSNGASANALIIALCVLTSILAFYLLPTLRSHPKQGEKNETHHPDSLL